MAFLSGKCRHAAATAKRQGPKQAAGWHAECKGSFFTHPGGPVEHCDCACHFARRRTVREQVAEARRERLVAAGLDPDQPNPRRSRERGYCKHDHEMTAENTGPRGECRACKRAASQKCKARKTTSEESSQ